MALQTESRATGKRLSKYRRIEHAVPHVLTDRDMAIIAAVADYRLLSRSQIQRLLGFGTVTRVNFRLQKLFHHGYLVRHFLPTLKGSSQAIYALDRLGLPVAAERLGKDAAALWRFKDKLSPFFLAHELAVNDVRIAFELAARTHNDHQLVMWLSAEETKDRFFFGTKWRTLTPDAFLCYRVGKQVLSAFVEVDQGTMPNRRFKEKVERYFAYDVSLRFTERYKGQRFRVVVVTDGPMRLANLKETAAPVAQRYCWFTTLAELREHGPLANIWQVVGREGRSPLSPSDRKEGDA
ncbi:MAG: replication-relaxation family protein [bacterium]